LNPDAQALRRLIESKPPPRPKMENYEKDFLNFDKDLEKIISKTPEPKPEIIAIASYVLDSIKNPTIEKVLKPTPGITHICPDCRQLLYSDKLSRELHKKSCSGLT
jgi:hypothetical protein